ncbi:hypothetical protein KP509_09G097300 [Ceratopteris richardii]|uniref:EngB-type G domain-containing protein n=1 Tax=Ceratopteris richardii TaxID=49495 RepID=A0A8T2U505_CERRI|nr:hypothetical protein KP509_09G097300 [Ceratopteris richardii]
MFCRFGRRGSSIIVSLLSRDFSSNARSGRKPKQSPEQQQQLRRSLLIDRRKHLKQSSHLTSVATTVSSHSRGKLHPSKEQQEKDGAVKDEMDCQSESTEDCSAPSAEEDDVFLPPGSVSSAGLRRLPCSNIFVGVTSSPAHIEHAEFVKSSVNVQDCPKGGLPEFAFVGRSNVGKSSLINTLVCRRQLAKTSKTPGKTQVINHFIIDKSWYLVDLPGYGFARAPSSIRVSWDSFTRDYFLKRQTLVCVLLLVDASVQPKKSDAEYADWLASNKVPYTLVFTKCDKRRSRNKNAAQNNVFEFLKLLKDEDVKKIPPWVMTSCVNRQGTNELLLHLAHLRDHWKKRSSFALPMSDVSE